MKKIIFLSVISLFLLLESCVAVLVAGAAAGMVVYDKRSIGTVKTDTAIFHSLNTEIQRERAFGDSRIRVTSFNRVVLLVGQTSQQSLRVLAEKMAQKTKNVHRVYNKITVEYPIAYSRQTEDAWITSQTKSLMLAEKGLRSGSIRVITENGVVYLIGLVTRQQAELSVNVARDVEGVNKVVKAFQYIG